MWVGMPKMLPLDYEQLKQRQRAERANYPDNLSLRVHRALSWLSRYESCCKTLYRQFNLLWLAFNAVYVQHRECLNFSEAATASQFVTKICALVSKQCLTNLVWNVYTSSFWLLLDNQYIFQPSWDNQNGHNNTVNWHENI
jgi:hypothetical protein